MTFMAKQVSYHIALLKFITFNYFLSHMNIDHVPMQCIAKAVEIKVEITIKTRSHIKMQLDIEISPLASFRVELVYVQRVLPRLCLCHKVE